MVMVKTTPEHLVCLEEVKQLMIRWAGQIAVNDLQAILAQCIGYLVPLGEMSVEQIDDLVSGNVAMGIAASYQTGAGDEG